MKNFLLIALSVVQLIGFGQTNLTLPIYKHIVNFDYENDLFARTDRYYTQGLSLNYSFLRDSRKVPQFRIKTVKNAFSIGLRHQAFTPTTIKKDSALYNDRPYAALISGNFNYIRVDTIQGYSFSAGLELGFVGPAAQGKEMQTAIHKATNNFIPLGWEYQVANGLILDVAFAGEKSILKTRNVFQAIGRVDGRFGTFQTNLRPSFTLMFGNLKNYSVYFYSQSSMKVIAYDGTLQGALIGKESIVVVPNYSINRLVAEEEVGFRFQTGNFGGALHYSVQSRTFQYQKFARHAWGEIGLFWRF